MVIRFKNIIEIIFDLIKGEIQMVDLYIALVIAGRRTCNTENNEVTQVPTRYRDVVIKELEVLGLDTDGNPLGA